MAHNLAVINGKHAFFGTKPAWHELGQVVTGAQTWNDAMNLAQLNWTVSKHKLLSPFTQEQLEAWGIFRDDTNELIGVVGDKYTPIQNEFAFQFVDALLEADGQAHYETAGALHNGSKLWCMAKINGDVDITGTGDVHQYYLLFVTSHDGSTSNLVKLTDTRVVCNNTLNIALKGNGSSLKIKHTKTAEGRLAQARSLVSHAHVQIHDLEFKLRELAKRKVKRESYFAVMKRLFGDIEESKRAENKVLEITQFFESNDNNMFPEIRGTSYNLLNAITEYTDHAAGFRQTSRRDGHSDNYIRAENAMFGNGSDLKEKALDVIYECTANDPRYDPVHIYIPQHTPLLDSILDEAA